MTEVPELATRDADLPAVPLARELVYDMTYAGSVAYTLTGTAIYRNHLNPGFNRGTELADPASMLEGTGCLVRHVRIAGSA